MPLVERRLAISLRSSAILERMLAFSLRNSAPNLPPSVAALRQHAQPFCCAPIEPMGRGRHGEQQRHQKRNGRAGKRHLVAPSLPCNCRMCPLVEQMRSATATNNRACDSDNMDIFFNTNPEFTRWMVSSGALREPFVVIDVGVLGGENPRWHFLGDHLVVHGFDAIREGVDKLTARNANASNKRYHWLAIGHEDGEREFFFKPSNPTNSSFYRVPDPELQSRTVPVRRLDSLLEEGVIPQADFLKVDVEGFEGSVLLGASKLLASGVLGVEIRDQLLDQPNLPQDPLRNDPGGLASAGHVRVRHQLQSCAARCIPAGSQAPKFAPDAIGRVRKASYPQRPILPGFDG